MPITPQEQRELDELELKELEAKQNATAALPRTSSDFNSTAARSGFTSDQPNLPRGNTGAIIDLGLEAGLPAAGQVITAPFVETGLTSAVGSGLSLLGNALAQGRRIMSGEQSGWSEGQSAQAGLTGAIPFLGPAKAGAGVLRAAANIGTNMALQGAGGAAGVFARSAIDQGAAPPSRDVFLGTAIPALFGGFGSAVANRGAQQIDRGRRILENADVFGRADVTPTPGMLLPEELASIEQKMARDKPNGLPAQRIDQTRSDMMASMAGMSPNATEGAAIFGDLKPLLGQITTTEDEIAKLSDKAIAARKVAGEKFRALRDNEKAQQSDIDQAVRKDAETAMNEEYNANLGSVLDNARNLITERAAGGVLSSVDPATFRTIAREQVAMPLRAAFKEKADQLYSLVNNDVKGFDAAPILREVDNITGTASGRLPTDLQSAVNDIHAMLGTADEHLPVSLQDLRRARDQLMSRVDTGVPISTNEQRLITGITSKINEEITSQAGQVLGEDAAAALRTANEYYSKTRPLFDKPGVKVLFSTDPADEFVGKVIRGIQASGIKSDEYANMMALVDEIKKTHPEQASAVEDLFKRNLHDSIIHQSSVLDPQTGVYRVDGEKLAKNLEPMGKVDGTLEALGFGDREKVAELNRLFSDYKDAAKLTDRQWEGLLSSDAFQTAASGRELRPLLAPFLAASAADAEVVRSAALFKAGQVEKSRQAFLEAENTLKTVRGDLGALQRRRDSLLRDPVTVALDNPNLPSSGYDAFANAFFNPSPSKVTNDQLAGIVGAMEKGPRDVRLTLDRLRERYIADQVAQFRTTPDSSQLAQELDVSKMRQFFEGNPGDAASEINRARTILTPDQMSRLDDMAEAVRKLDLYERRGPELLKPGSYDTPAVGMIRRSWDAIVDLYRKGEYAIVAKALMRPADFARSLQRSGAAAQTAGAAATQAGQGVGRDISR